MKFHIISAIIFLLFFICKSSSTKKETKYTHKYYRFLDVPTLRLRNEINDSISYANYIKGIYADDSLCKLELHYEGEVINDSVVYNNNSVFYIEHYKPRYPNDIKYSYIVRRYTKNKLITYWLIENKGESLKLYAIDSIYKIWSYNRYYTDYYTCNNVLDFIDNLDNRIPTVSIHQVHAFTIFIKNDTANILMQGISTDEQGVNGQIGDTLKSMHNADSTFFQFVQLQYFYPYIIDPFLWGHWK